MTSNKTRLIWVFVGLACLLLAPNLLYGVREAHDIKFHAMLFLSYRDALELGTLYPRWLPDQLHGLGSPALLIYPPLTSAFFALIDVLTLHTLGPERLLGLGALLLSMASAATFYLWARAFASARLALIAALFYATGPYHLNLDLYARGAMAEYTAFVWLPLIFFGIRSTLLAGTAGRAALLACSIGALFLTHLLTAMLIAPLALAYALMCLRLEVPAGRRVQRFAVLAVTASLGVALAAFYFVPAVLLLPQANAAGLQYDVATTNIFFALRTLSDRFQVKLLLLACAYLIFSLYLLGQTWRNWRGQRMSDAAARFTLLWIVCAIICFALMSGFFPFLFRSPSPYAQIQFGWRLLAIMEFSLVSLFVCCVAGTHHAASHARLLKVGVIVLLAIMAVQSLDITARFHNVPVFATPLQDNEKVRWRLAPIEYFPIGTQTKQGVDVALRPFEHYARASQSAFIAGDKSRLVSAMRKGAVFTVHTKAAEPTPVLIQQFYFPGWQARDEHGTDIAVFRDDVSRLASYVAPAGEHTVVVRRVATAPERWGMLISSTALVLLALQLVFLRWRRRASPPSGR